MNTPEFFDIQSLTFDLDLQVRVRINDEQVTQYAECMASETEMQGFPPVEIFYDGVKYWLADGHHRRAAAEKAGHTKVWAIVKSGTRADALWAAIIGNGKQGFGLTTNDRKRAIMLAIQQWPDRSNRMIAEAVGCSRDSVRRMRDEISTGADAPVEKDKSGGTNVLPEKKLSSTAANDAVERRIGKDGKSRPVIRKAKNESSPKVINAGKKSQEKPQTEIVSIKKVQKERQHYSCGVHFEPEPDDNFFDWITDDERKELRERQKTCPNRLVPMIRNYTIQSIPEHDPQYLISCLFSLFKPLYREKLLLALARKMFEQDRPESVEDIIETLRKEFQSH